MENAFSSQLLTDSSPSPPSPPSAPGQTFAGLPETLKMQLGPFNPQQVQDSKTLSIQSLQASAFRLRYGSNYPRFPAHLIQHLQPQLFPAAVDQRLHFPPGAFRPFNVPSAQNKLFPSAFAPPLKPEGNGHESVQEISAGNYVSGYYGSETEEESNFRTNSEREIDFQSGGDQITKLTETTARSNAASTPSPQSSSAKEEKSEGCNGKGSESADVDGSENRGSRRGKVSLDPPSCPVCGIMVLLGDAEAHFFKELEKLSHITSLNREKKYLYDKYHEAQSCFGSFGTSSTSEENGGGGTGIDFGIPRGRWETYQRIKSNRLGRLRIKNRKKKNGDPVCPVCNEKIQGSVENINLHVEHCLKKHSDEAEEEEEEENIDVEGDSEVYGEYEWTAGLLTTATTSSSSSPPPPPPSSSSSSNYHHNHNHHNHHHHHQICEKEERIFNSHPDGGDDSSRMTPLQLSDSDVNVEEEEIGKEKPNKNQIDESNFEKFSSPKPTNRV